jgi:hypothetical protein
MTGAAAEQRAKLRRLLAWTFVVTLCIAALTAIGAIVSGDFDDTDARVIGSSVGFAVFSATAASGAGLRYRHSENLRSLGLVTIALSVLSFLLLALALWRDWDGGAAWQWFGCAALGALAASHASLVAGARRPSDGEGVRLLATASISLAAVDALFGILAISEVVDEVDESFGQLLAVLVVLLVLTSALQPVVRRLQRSLPAAAGAERPAAPREPARSPLATELLVAADRIEALNADPARRSAEIRRECERLRELARSYER